MPDPVVNDQPLVVASFGAAMRHAMRAQGHRLLITWPDLPESPEMARRARCYVRGLYRAARMPIGSSFDLDDGIVFGKGMRQEVARTYTVGFMAVSGWKIEPL